MKAIVFISTIVLACRLGVKAQIHIDTVRVEGYYIVNVLKREQNCPKTIRINDTTIKIIHLTDMHEDESFIPKDSITPYKGLSYWLHHFFDKTDKVFISCNGDNVNDFLPDDDKRKESHSKRVCTFPKLTATTLYETTDVASGDVYHIYYMDAEWVKIPMDKESIKATEVPGTIAEVCIDPNIRWYSLYCFLKCYSFETYPVIEDDCIGIWDKMSEK